MGAAASQEEELIGGVRPQRIPTTKSSWRSKKNFVLAKWSKREQQSQAFGVVRHAERADSVYALYQGTRWTQTEDFIRWPMDPPLSDAGVEAAFEETAQRIARFSVENHARIPIVVTSPYFRCVQTAVEVCRALGPGVRLLIDNSLGEVYGPAVMGERQPIEPTRPMDQIVYYCKSRGVKCMSKSIGKWPQWPEDLQAARRRYADRFLTFLQRSTVAKRNFILVTHGDCVGATVTMMPSQGGSKLEKVEYGGMFLGKRQDRRGDSKGSNASSGSSGVGMTGVLPTAVETDEDPDEEAEVVDNPRFWKEVSSLDRPMEGGWMQDGDASSSAQGKPREFCPPEPPKASDGWQVETHDLILRAKGRPTTNPVAQVFTKKMTSLVKNSKFSKEQIESLLGELTDKPLGDTDEIINSAAALRRTENNMGGRSSTNYSTLLFGASECGTVLTQSEIGDVDSQIGAGSDSNLATFTNESFEHYMSVLKGAQQRRRQIRQKTQASQPKTPKLQTMPRTDEEVERASADAQLEELRGSDAARADELVCGALWSSEAESGLNYGGSCELGRSRTLSIEADLTGGSVIARGRTVSRNLMSNASTSPRTPTRGSGSSAWRLEDGAMDGLPSDDSTTRSEKRSSVDYGRAHLAFGGGGGSTPPLDLASQTSSSSSGKNILSVTQLMAQHKQQVFGIPSSGKGVESVTKDTSPTRSAKPTVLGGLQNSALMRRRGVDPPQEEEKQAASSSQGMTEKSGFAPLGGLQNSLLMRRRGLDKASASAAAADAAMLPGRTSPEMGSGSPTPSQSSTSSLSGGNIATGFVDLSPLSGGAEKVLLPSAMQNSSLMKRRNMELKVGVPAPLAPDASSGAPVVVPPRSAGSSAEAAPLAPLNFSGMQNSKLMKRRAVQLQEESADTAPSRNAGPAPPSESATASASKAAAPIAVDGSSSPDVSGGCGIQFASLSNSKLMKRRNVDTAALETQQVTQQAGALSAASGVVSLAAPGLSLASPAAPAPAHGAEKAPGARAAPDSGNPNEPPEAAVGSTSAFAVGT